MPNLKDDDAVGYKRPPKSAQFKKGQSGNPGGVRRRRGPIKLDVEGILNESFPVMIEGKTRNMSAKEIEIRQILKKAVGRKDFRSIAHLLDLFEKHGCVAHPKKRVGGVITLPTNSMAPGTAGWLLKHYGFPEDWTKRQIARARKKFENGDSK